MKQKQQRKEAVVVRWVLFGPLLYVLCCGEGAQTKLNSNRLWKANDFAREVDPLGVGMLPRRIGPKNGCVRLGSGLGSIPRSSPRTDVFPFSSSPSGTHPDIYYRFFRAQPASRGLWDVYPCLSALENGGFRMKVTVSFLLGKHPS